MVNNDDRRKFCLSFYIYIFSRAAQSSSSHFVTTDSGSYRWDHNADDGKKTTKKKRQGRRKDDSPGRKSEMCSGTFNNPSMKLLVIRDAIPDTPDLITHPPCCCLVSYSRSPLYLPLYLSLSLSLPLSLPLILYLCYPYFVCIFFI